MSLGALGVLSFSAPWLLAGLLTLPFIWWLLRFTPPRARRVRFPPLLLLRGLLNKEQTPEKTPWWLVLLRCAVVAAVVLALAGPHLRPPAAATATPSDPILVVVDSGWAAASRWDSRVSLANELAMEAENGNAVLYLAATTDLKSELTPLTPKEFRQRFASLEPEAFPGERAALAEKLKSALGQQEGRLHVVWLSDGIKDEGADSLAQTLAKLARPGGFEFSADPVGQGALALSVPKKSAQKGLTVRVHKAEAEARKGSVAALTSKGERLAVSPFDVPSGAASVDAIFELPLEIRNQVAKFEIASEASAAAVYLLDGRSQRKKVGILASEDAEKAQPLLSPSHYLEKALSPFAELSVARTSNIDEATQDFLRQSASVVILSDVGRLIGPSADRLKNFVERGGILIRFAGARLEHGGDQLLPVPLREGGRALGGALTWAAPQALAPFEQGSLFRGLNVPADVTVSRQVLADPSRLSPAVKVWARLADGTPLVTAASRGLGQIVFFHVTANTDWSNLPLSGLFVDMLRALIDAAPLQIASIEAAGAATKEAQGQGQSGLLDDQTLKPRLVLDGFGKLIEPKVEAKPVAASELAKARATRQTPPGLYGPKEGFRALNVMSNAPTLAPLSRPESAVERRLEAKAAVPVAPWLFLAAFCLFLADTFIAGAAFSRWARLGRATAALAAILMIAVVGQGQARAQSAGSPNAPARTDAATQFALKASLETRLAYVLTGDAETDRVSFAGLSGLSKILISRTAVEPGEPIAIDPARDDLVFFPLIYWPVLPNAEPLPDKVSAKLDAYMKQGGLVIFDTKNEAAMPTGNLSAASPTALGRLLAKLDIPPLQRVPENHVLTRSFYLLQSFPGRWDNGDTWVEASTEQAGDGRQAKAVKSDGVSSIIVTSNDLAAAWALDDNDRAMFAVVPGGEEQRELSYRTGVNIVMYALTGNYKADQVHVPFILDRLGH